MRSIARKGQESSNGKPARRGRARGSRAREIRDKHTGSLIEFTDEQGRQRFKIGIVLPEPIRSKSGQLISRQWQRLAPGTTEPSARATLENWIKEVPTDPALRPPKGGETVVDWVDRWFADRTARGMQTKVDRGRLNVHVFPAIGSKAMADVTTSDLEGIVEALDRKVQAGEIKWKTASNVWGVVSKMFDDSANAKTRALRVREHNPAAGVRGPDRGERTLKQYLYPSEFLEVTSSPDASLEWARTIALGVYFYVRLGELEALEWEDLDLERGIAHVHRAINREDGEIKATKTDMPRKFPIEPALLPLLRVMKEESGGKGRVITLPSETNHARALRSQLTHAKVKRAELFAQNDKSRKQITAYDLRATGITWRAVRGDDPLKIMSAAGHRSFATTQSYIREAEPLREGFGDVFPPLPDRLLDPSKDPSKVIRKRSATTQVHEIIVPKEGLEPRPKSEIAGVLPAFAKSTHLALPTTERDNPAKAGQRISCGSEDGVKTDPVEAALAVGIEGATRAGRWDVVAQLARQLEARHAARADAPSSLDERALAVALDVAAAAGDLEKIDRIVAELRERRQARAGVLQLEVERGRRKG